MGNPPDFLAEDHLQAAHAGKVAGLGSALERLGDLVQGDGADHAGGALHAMRRTADHREIVGGGNLALGVARRLYKVVLDLGQRLRIVAEQLDQPGARRA